MSKKSESKKYSDYAKVEENYSVKLDSDVRGYGNEVLKEIIDSVAIDSKKHAGLYRACAAIIDGHSLSVTDIEYEQLQKSLKDHIAIEVDMIKTVEALLKTTKDPRIKMMLEHIRDDEYRHHKLLKAIGELVVKKEIILEKDIWNMLFRDALKHGAPEGQWEEKD